MELDLWWACEMKGGGMFMVFCAIRPEGVIRSVNCSIAAGSYDVLYGPCSEDEARDFMADMAGAGE